MNLQNARLVFCFNPGLSTFLWTTGSRSLATQGHHEGRASSINTFYIAAVGDFNSHQDFKRSVKLGEPLNVDCPPHGPSFGVTFTWTSKKARSIQFPISNRVAINPSTGNLHIMYVTQEDVSTLTDLEGIRCTISGANTFYTSGTLTLQILPGDDWFLLLYCFIIVHLVKALAVLVTLPQLRTLWYFSQHSSGFLFYHIL